MDLLDKNYAIVSALLTATFVLVKWLVDKRFATAKSRREAIEILSKALLQPIEKMSNQQKLITEEILNAFYGKDISFYEFSVLLTSKSPKLAIDTYLRYRQYLKIDNGKVTYQKRPGFEIKLPFMKVIVPIMLLRHIFGYVLFAFVGLYIIQAAGNIFLLVDFSKMTSIEAIKSTMNHGFFLFVGVFFLVIAIKLLTTGLGIPSRRKLEASFAYVFEKN